MVRVKSRIYIYILMRTSLFGNSAPTAVAALGDVSNQLLVLFR